METNVYYRDYKTQPAQAAFPLLEESGIEAVVGHGL